MDWAKTPWWQVLVPVDLVLDHGLSPGARLLYLRLAEGDRAAPWSLSAVRRLGALSGYSSTQRHLASLLARGWLTSAQGKRGTVYRRVDEGPSVAIPGSLIQDQSMTAGAICLYASLAGQRRRTGGDTAGLRPALLAAAGLGSNSTARRQLRQLQASGWLAARFLTRSDGHAYIPQDPHLAARQAERKRIRLRLRSAPYLGEALMVEMLLTLVDSTDFIANARPGKLANPLTGAALELDLLFYTLGIAFEFNGPQHYRATPLFPNATEVQLQQVRDIVKTHLARELGIQLFTLQAPELTYSQLRELLARAAPLRPWRRADPVVQLLDAASRAYLARTRAEPAGRHGGPAPEFQP